MTEGRIFAWLGDKDISTVGPDQSVVKPDDVERRLASDGIPVVPFSTWEGFDETLYTEKDAKASRIAQLRQQRQSFKQDRQTEAEAEALIIIEKLRERTFRYGGGTVGNA